MSESRYENMATMRKGARRAKSCVFGFIVRSFDLSNISENQSVYCVSLLEHWWAETGMYFGAKLHSGRRDCYNLHFGKGTPGRNVISHGTTRPKTSAVSSSHRPPRCEHIYGKIYLGKRAN